MLRTGQTRAAFVKQLSDQFDFDAGAQWDLGDAEGASRMFAEVSGDLVKDGVCGVFIARKMRVSQPTASEHLKILQQAGLVRAKRIKQWTFYKRNEAQIEKIKRLISAAI